MTVAVTPGPGTGTKNRTRDKIPPVTSLDSKRLQVDQDGNNGARDGFGENGSQRYLSSVTLVRSHRQISDTPMMIGPA